MLRKWVAKLLSYVDPLLKMWQENIEGRMTIRMLIDLFLVLEQGFVQPSPVLLYCAQRSILILLFFLFVILSECFCCIFLLVLFHALYVEGVSEVSLKLFVQTYGIINFIIGYSFYFVFVIWTLLKHFNCN